MQIQGLSRRHRVIECQSKEPKESKNAADEMRKLDFMVGNWEGKGSAESPSGREDFAIRDTVTPKLDGAVLVLESKHLNEAEPHQALATVSYDQKNESYRYDLYRPGGHHDSAPAYLVGENTLEWTIPMGPRELAFEITVQDGQWHETGKVSCDDADHCDGEKWHSFLDQTMERVPDTWKLTR